MKDLITIFTYCPDIERKLILEKFVNKIQKLKNNFDILIVSHSQIPETVSSLVNYVFIDNENYLLNDFDYRNKFWFDGDILTIESTLVYPPSTHYAIYSLVHYVINFSKHRGYKKIHCIEYDIDLENYDLIQEVNDDLNKYNNVIFEIEEDKWALGTYFAFNVNNLPNEYCIHDKNSIIEDIKKIENRMTEDYTKKFLSVNERTTLFKTSKLLNSKNNFQFKDNHKNDELNWCVPVYNPINDIVYFFVFNEKGHNFEIDLLYNEQYIKYTTIGESAWFLEPICRIEEFKNILVMVNKKIKYNIQIDDTNLDKFKRNNFVKYI